MISIRLFSILLSCIDDFHTSVQHPALVTSKPYGWGTMLQARRFRVRTPMRSLTFFQSSSRFMSKGLTRHVTEMSTGKYLGIKRGQRVRLTNWPPPMNRFCRQLGILQISQLWRPPRPVTGIALLVCVFCVRSVLCPLLFV
jgi:hypothetical protein